MPEHHAWYCWDGDSLLLSLRVQPRASHDELAEAQQDRLRVRITAPPVDGKANAHLLRFLAKAFGTPRSRVSLVGGKSSRNKRVCIEAPTKLPVEVPRK